MRVSDIMSTDLITCAPEDSIRTVAELMAERGIGAIPVVDPDSGEALGMITDRDIAIRCVAEDLDPEETDARSLMSSPAQYVAPETSLGDCCHEMVELGVRRVLIADGQGQALGIVTIGDIARAAGPEDAGSVLKALSAQAPQEPSAR